MARYVCPECGAGGGHAGNPFFHNGRYLCHVCEDPVLMLQAINDTIQPLELERTDLVSLSDYLNQKNK